MKRAGIRKYGKTTLFICISQSDISQKKKKKNSRNSDDGSKETCQRSIDRLK
jgi:hypothetical protein